MTVKTVDSYVWNKFHKSIDKRLHLWTLSQDSDQAIIALLLTHQLIHQQ